MNGGLANDWLHGKQLAAVYMIRDEEKRFRRAFFWDAETHQWVPKDELYQDRLRTDVV